MNSQGIDGLPVHDIEEMPQGSDYDMDHLIIGPDGQPISPTPELVHNEEEEDIVDKFAEPGRVRRFATIMNVMNTLLGAGILSVPQSFVYCGIIPSLIVLFIIAALSHVASVLTIRLQKRTGASGYDELANIILGKYGSGFLSFFSLFFLLCLMIAYLVVGSDMLASWLRLAGVTTSTTWSRALLVLIYALVLPIALSVPKSVAFLSYFSTATVICITFFVLTMIVKSFVYFPSSGISSTVVVGQLGIGIFSAISIYGLSFALPAVILPVLEPYNKDTNKRGIVSEMGVVASFILVAIPAIVGYLMFGSSCKDNILNNFSDSDALMIIVRIGFFLVVSFSYPCISKSVQCSWSQVFYNIGNPNTLPESKRGIILVVTNIIPLAVACFLPNIRPALSIGGALGGCIVDFLYPPLMWIVLSKKSIWHRQNVLCIIFCLFGLVTAIISTYQAVQDAIAAFKTT